MRKPQSTFVVEYKGGRRQKRSPNASIWGTVDLTSLAKEIEGDLPVEASTKAEVTPNADGRRRAVPGRILYTGISEPEVEAGLNAGTSEAGHLVIYDNTVADEGTLTQDEYAHVEQMAAAQPPDQPIDKPDGAQPAPDDHGYNLASASAETVPASRSELVSREELATLDAENVQLKARLAQKLAAENCRLQKMLDRFLN